MVMKCFPGTPVSFGRDACAAAIAAGMQGKFWEMHDEMVREPKLLAGKRDAVLPLAAKKIGLDVARWEADRRSPDVDRRIDADVTLGKSATVSGSPTIFVNGIRLAGARPIEDIRKVVNSELGR